MIFSSRDHQILVGANLPSTFLKNICSRIGIPIALDKTMEPSTTIIFLGIEFDTIHNATSQDKLVSLRKSIQTVMISKKVSLKVLHSLIGLLNLPAKQ